MNLSIKSPTLLIDEQKVRRNIGRITDKGEANNTELIPHFKTHQSIAVGEWFRDFGVKKITVSSVAMALYFAKNGWKFIYVAFPLNVREIESINELAKEVELTVLINEIEQVDVLDRMDSQVNVKIEIECGSNRSGVAPENLELLSTLISKISNSKHKFEGFYSHFGHTYRAKSVKAVEDIYSRSIAILDNLKASFAQYNPIIATGDTPSASCVTDLSNLASVHAGNYVFYDLTQSQIGVCTEDDIAIVLAAPVVAKNKERCELVVHGGGVHLSKETLDSDEFRTKIYGKLVALTDNGWEDSFPGCYMSSLSQEHGIAKVTPEIYNAYKVGDLIGILPVHSCMTADVMRGYQDLKGGKIDHFKGLAV